MREILKIGEPTHVEFILRVRLPIGVGNRLQDSLLAIARKLPNARLSRIETEQRADSNYSRHVRRKRLYPKP